MNGITTHVLDTSLGKPAAGIQVTLSRRDADGFVVLSRAVTDADGRVRAFEPPAPLVAAVYRLTFDTAAYFRAAGRESFFEGALLDFSVTDVGQHHHVPLLLTPFGYTTYRGS